MGDSVQINTTIDTNTDNQEDDFNLLRNNEEILVWATKQDDLEQQALKELEIFVEETKNCHQVEGCLEDEISDRGLTFNSKSSGNANLNVHQYIKHQEELKKQKELKRSISVQLTKRSTDNTHKDQRNVNKEIKCFQGTKRRFKYEVVDRNESKNDMVIYKQKPLIHVNETLLDGLNFSGSESEYVPSEGELSDSDYEPVLPKVSKIQKRVTKRKIHCTPTNSKIIDDGLLQNYNDRLNLYYKKLEEENYLQEITNAGDEIDETDHHILKGGLKVPSNLWNKLYSYQHDGVEWLWKLHQIPTGGLLGDEMGLGKTVQIIVFLQSLQYSRIISAHGRFTGVGPSIIVCPATVIHQWLKHFHEWAPEFRVVILHQSGSIQGNKADLIKEMHRAKGIIITTYLGILKYKGNLVEYTWHYIILDEGHKIRNPAAKVSIAVKHLRTPHRIMLTGSPMQNNLNELWSLFDFTNPGMLGNLATFQDHFANPILQGGFANSSPMQEATARSIATALKNMISPYLLRRSKAEVQNHIFLPNKSEQVLFCSLTQEQRDLYMNYLMSEHVNMILGRGVKNWYSDNYMKANILMAITTLRKICNHPDLYLSDSESKKNELLEATEEQFGYYKKSGKMVVVSALLKIWKKQSHRVLLFTQGKYMLKVFEKFLQEQGYNFLKMDGSTNISSRQPLIDKFNQDTSYDVFLLTTRVGGLGVNLTGANRVIIYDPDWNPATDTQARERAWRIGQEKDVTIYRLICAGTIEEKMYQRQVWKQLLSNKVLLDPSTHRFFKSSDLHDLFSLQEPTNTNPETTSIFHNSRVKIQENYKNKQKVKREKKVNISSSHSKDATFSADKVQAMKHLAKQIAKSLSQNKDEPEVHKTSFQSRLEKERQRKLKEKEELKKLTPLELMEYNRRKAELKDESHVNKIDNSETNLSFDKALEYSEKTTTLCNDLNSGKNKFKRKLESDSDSNCASSFKTKEILESFRSKHKSKKHRKNKKHKSEVVISHKVDGEEVEGLVKCETKRNKKTKLVNGKVEDNYVLEHLFSKKGVSGALQHDSVVSGSNKIQSLKVQTEAKRKTDKALEALKKSRLNNWRW